MTATAPTRQWPALTQRARPISLKRGDTRRVAIVDETEAASHAAAWLRDRGWECEPLPNPELSPPAIRQWLELLRPQVIIVEPAVLPPPQWRWLSASVADLAIVVWSGPSKLPDRVRALRWGVEHWLTKPVEPDELVATLETVSRYLPALEEPSVQQPLRIGELEFDPSGLLCRVRGVVVNLSVREFALLNCLVARYGHLVEREQLYVRVWGGATMTQGERSVDVFIGKLRAKLSEASPGWSYIHTRRHIGYWLEAIPVSDDADAPFLDL